MSPARFRCAKQLLWLLIDEVFSLHKIYIVIQVLIRRWAKAVDMWLGARTMRCGGTKKSSG